MSNITTFKTDARQTVLSAYVSIDFADLVAAGAVAADTLELMTIPRNAIITSVVLEVPTAFVHATSTDLTMSVEDTKSSATTYVPATDLDSAAVTAISDDTPVEYSAASTLTATLAGTDLGGITAGQAIVVVNYIQKGRSNEVQE